MSEFNPYQFEIAERLDRGIYWAKSNIFHAALKEFIGVLELDPGNRYALWNKALMQLCLGDYYNGLPGHDNCWKVYDPYRNLGNFERVLSLPLWQDEACDLFVYHEMGFGDAIMLLRFLPELVHHCKSVTLWVRPELVSLMQGHGAEVVSVIPEQLSKFDAQTSLFHSVATMRYTLHTIPSMPYIWANSEREGGRIGIAWSGSSQQQFSAESFMDRIDTKQFTWIYALQKSPPVECVFPLQWDDFDTTARFMMKLDHIVTVDTAVAHLAGAIGHPSAHLILPYVRDWRWWNASTWYPTLNVYPQPEPNDWETPFRQVNEALKLP